MTGVIFVCRARRCASSWLSTTMSSSAGASSISPSPSRIPCRGRSVHSSRTMTAHVRPGRRRHPSVCVKKLKKSQRRRAETSAVVSADVVPECEKSSATTYYWYRQALDISDSISEGGGLNWKMTLSLLAAWTLVCLAMIKGIQSSGKVRTTRGSCGNRSFPALPAVPT